MKFILHREADSKSQKIPYAALQISALAGATELAVQTGDGCILICRNELTVREAASTIAQLNAIIESLMEELVDASKEAARELEDVPDPLDELDEEVLDNLLACGADSEGLRFILEMEALADE